MSYNYQDAPRESQQEYFGKVHTDNKEILQNALKRIEELKKENAELKEALAEQKQYIAFKCEDNKKIIDNLRQENAELKEKYSDNLSLKDEELMCLETDFNTYKSEAKELLKRYVDFPTSNDEVWELHKEAEQFLKETDE